MASDYWDRYFRRARRMRTSRRRFLQGSAIAGIGAAGLGLVGCGDDDEEEPTATSEPGETPDPTATSEPGETPQPTATATARAGETPQPTATATEAPPDTSAVPTDGSYYSQVGEPFVGITLDIHRGVSGIAGGVEGSAYSGLIRFDDIPAPTFRGDLARHLPEQPDAVTYIFELRDNVVWHEKPPTNGRPFTMDDVRWNLDRQLTRTLADGTVADDFTLTNTVFTHIDSLDYVNDETISFTLKQPRGTWLESLAFAGFMDQGVAEQIESDPDVISADRIVGTGGYMFTEFVPDGRRIAERHPNWHLRQAGEEVQYFDALALLDVGADVNAVRIALEQKQVDWIGGRFQRQAYAPEFMQAIQDANSDIERLDVPALNANRALIYSWEIGPFSNPLIRQAFYLALDRQLVLQQDFAGEGRITGPLPWAFTDWALSEEEILQQPGYALNKDDELQEARQLWEAGGGEDLEDNIELVANEPDAVRLSEWFTAMMNGNLGTDKIEVKGIPGGSILPYLTGEDPIAFLTPVSAWTSPDPRQRLARSYTTAGSINFGKYSNPGMDDLFDQAAATLDRDEAISTMKDIQRLAMTESGAGTILMAAATGRFLKWPYLKMEFNPWRLPVDERSWIDQSDSTFSGRPSL